MNTITSMLVIFARTSRVSSFIPMARMLYGALPALYLASTFIHLRFREETASQVSDRFDLERLPWVLRDAYGGLPATLARLPVRSGRWRVSSC